MGPTFLVSGVILTRVDLVNQPVSDYVFGCYYTCRIIVVVVVVIFDHGLLFELEVVCLDFMRYVGDVLTNVDLGTDCEMVN